jgi:hypothetical protein
MATATAFNPTASLAACAKKVAENPVTDDADIANKLNDIRDMMQAAATVADVGLDSIYTAIYNYDKSKGLRATERANKVVKYGRYYTKSVRFAHRFMMKCWNTYQKSFAADIAEENAAKAKTAFKPGRR